MAHYAVLDEDNVVIEVLTGMDEDDLDNLPEGFTDWESFYSSVRDDKTVVRTSYNTKAGVHLNDKEPLRGNYAGIGYHYLPEEDVFLPPRRYDYFVPDLTNYVWKPPIDKPDEQNYYWDNNAYLLDNTQGWILIPEPE
jgi:hypothetical protein